ncbi:MAG: type IV toxin-antitoxin system AbiEi family antitoxin domain-containing protein [Bellilinea sp.]
MKYPILSSLDSFPYFTIEAVKQLLGDESAAAGTIQTALYRWMKAGQIIQLKKGVYMTRRFFELHRADADFAPMVSAILIPQSYLSMEYILQRNATLTEMTYPVTAVTLKQTRVFENKLGTFTYRNIKADLYQGFTFSEYLGIPFSQATVAKALFDFLYLRPWKSSRRLAGYNLAEELRLNLEDFLEKDQDEFVTFVGMSKSRKMDQILKNLRKTVWRH